MGFFTWNGEKPDGWHGMSAKERAQFLSTRDARYEGMTRKQFKKAKDAERAKKAKAEAEGKKKGFFSWD